YAFVGWQPNMGRDPRGEETLPEALKDGELTPNDIVQLDLTEEESKEILSSQTVYVAADPRDPNAAKKNRRAAINVLLFRNRAFRQNVDALYDLTRAVNPVHFSFETGWAIGSGRELVKGTEVDRGEKTLELVTYLAVLKGTEWVFGRLATALNPEIGPTQGAAAAYERVARFRAKTNLGESDTVAFVPVNGRNYFGVNSGAQPQEALALRQEFLTKVQQELGVLEGKTLNRVQAFTHAESHALMRAYTRQGSLPSEVTIYVDRISCNFCAGKTGVNLLRQVLGIKKVTMVSPGRTVVLSD
ncbi:MAG: deaminase, partial [bacterium]